MLWSVRCERLRNAVRKRLGKTQHLDSRSTTRVQEVLENCLNRSIALLDHGKSTLLASDKL